jgi:hypothetical protein
MALSIVACARGVAKSAAGPSQARHLIVGAWHLARLHAVGPDGTMQTIADAKGSLIYTPTGVVSVQVMYATPISNEYTREGYEGSFGRYVIDEATKTVTHHYEGSFVRSLIGHDLPRRYEFVDGRLIISPTRADEHWSVVWERVIEEKNR